MGAALLLLVGSATACSSSDEGGPAEAADAPIEILWIGDLSGPGSTLGAVQLAGVKGAAAYYNDRGGIQGRRVEVKAVSDNSDPVAAASVLVRELASGTPTMVWPGGNSTTSGALIPVLAKYPVFAIALVDGAGQCRTDAATKCPHTWALNAHSDIGPRSAVEWFQDQGHTRIGLLEETTPYSAVATPEFLKAAEAAGITVEKASFAAKTLDVTPQLQSLQRADVEAVYAAGIGSAQYVFAARDNLEWDIPVVFDPPASAVDLSALKSERGLEDTYTNTLAVVNAERSSDGVPVMVEWSKRYGDVTAFPLSVVATGWDTVVALNAAVTQAGGSLDLADLDAAMLELPPTDPLRTLSRRLGWTADDHSNVLGSTDDFVVTPAGPLRDGQVQAP